MKAIVNFRTLPNGNFKWIRNDQRRGFWRVLLVKNENGPTHLNSKNVVEVLYNSPAGIEGVTELSNYSLKKYEEQARQIAETYNTVHGE